jgi:regulator of protease activity HflC (stomatin/prohibitin superfamily)
MPTNEFEDPISRGIKWAFRFFLIIIAFFIITGFFTSVPAGHIGVKSTFGKVSENIYNSGLNFKEPWAKMHTFDLRTQKISLDNVEASDKEGQIVTGDIVVNYRIKDKNVARNLLLNVGDEKSYQDVLALDAKSAEGYKQATVKFEALEMLEKRNDLKELGEENILNLFPTEYFSIESITITDIRYTPSFDEAIQRKKDAIQNALAAENEVKVAEAEAAKSIAEAEGQKRVKILEAEAQAESLRLQRQEVTRDLIELRKVEAQIQAINKWDGVMPQIVTGGNSIPFINIDTQQSIDKTGGGG